VAAVAAADKEKSINGVTNTLPFFITQSGMAICIYGGSIFGLADVCTDGNEINVDITTHYISKSSKVFEAWLIDDGYKDSGYMLSMGKLLNPGILHFHEVMNNAKTYTDIVITQEPSW
jgi:hypothetical protein